MCPSRDNTVHYFFGMPVQTNTKQTQTHVHSAGAYQTANVQSLQQQQLCVVVASVRLKSLAVTGGGSSVD